eukprot:1547869-Prymnesium_polylepis.1
MRAAQPAALTARTSAPSPARARCAVRRNAARGCRSSRPARQSQSPWSLTAPARGRGCAWRPACQTVRHRARRRP